MTASLSRRPFLAGAAAAMLLLSAGAAFAAEKLVFAWSPAPQTPQVDIAFAEKAFEAAGLDLEVVTFPTGREAFEALTGGQADLATMAELPAITGALRAQPFAVVADLARYNGSRIVTSAKNGIAAPADLAGKRIGVTLGTNTDFLLSTVLEEAGVTAEIVNAAPGDLVAALVRGDVEAIVPFPNFYPAAKKTLGEDYREIPVSSYRGRFVLAAGKALLEERPEAVSAFLKALIEAEEKVKADLPAAAATVSEGLKGNISPEALLDLWAQTDIAVTLGDDLTGLLIAEGEWIVSKGVVKAENPTARSLAPYLAPGPLRAVDPARVTLSAE